MCRHVSAVYKYVWVCVIQTSWQVCSLKALNGLLSKKEQLLHIEIPNETDYNWFMLWDHVLQGLFSALSKLTTY